MPDTTVNGVPNIIDPLVHRHLLFLFRELKKTPEKDNKNLVFEVTQFLVQNGLSYIYKDLQLIESLPTSTRQFFLLSLLSSRISWNPFVTILPVLPLDFEDPPSVFQYLQTEKDTTIIQKLVLSAVTLLLSQSQTDIDIQNFNTIAENCLNQFNQFEANQLSPSTLYFISWLLSLLKLQSYSSHLDFLNPIHQQFESLVKMESSESSGTNRAEYLELSSGTSSAGHLASIIREVGYAFTFSVTVARAVFEKCGISRSNSFRTLQEDVIGHVLGMMANCPQGLREHSNIESFLPSKHGIDLKEVRQANQWNVDVFVKVVSELVDNLDWTRVLRCLDQRNWIVNEIRGLKIIIDAFKFAGKDISKFPISVFWGKWANVPTQLSYIRQFLLAPSDLINISLLSSNRVLTPDMGTNVTKSIISSLIPQPWNCLELYQTIALLSNGEPLEPVKDFLEFAMQNGPELTLLGLAQLPPPWSPTHTEVTSTLAMLFLSGHPSSPFVLSRLWQVNSNLSISSLQQMYSKDPSSLSRILDVAQEMKALSSILESKPYSFSIDLAALASRRDYLNLEKWLQDRIQADGDIFIRACLDFLNEKVNSQILGQDTAAAQSVPLAADVVAIFLKILHKRNSSMSKENAEFLKEIFSTCLQAYPRLMNVNPAADENPAGEAGTFSPDVEEEANSYYEKIYKGEMSLGMIVELLQRFKSSNVQRDKDIYSCMVHNLFDEYKFFPRYPDKELLITSMLFGALIQHQIVSYIPLGIALRYVLDALRQPIGSKLFKFGLQALIQFQSRLGEWPQYCSHLMQIAHLQQAAPEIISYIRTVEAQNTGHEVDKSSPENAVVFSTREPVSKDNIGTRSTGPTVFTALKLDTLLDAAGEGTFDVPSETIKDKILFNINNVSFDNLAVKVKEMKEVLKDNHYRWFSHYLVVKRASIEPNFHSLYIAYLDAFENNNLNRQVLHETFSNIKILLNSEKTVTSSSERSLLKNLGTWLGGITLAKNKPIRHKNLSFKDLLMEGYDNQRLIVVIPFVCKVLEQCSTSKVFAPPNPWLMAIMRLLAEFFHYAELKLNLKFEIEVLCKNIKLDIAQIEPTTLLRNRPRQQDQPDAVSSDLEKLAINSSIPSSAMMRLSGVSNAMSGEEPNLGLPNLSAYVTFNPNVPLFNAQSPLKRIVHVAIDRAIREIIAPVVERSVTIAAIATRELTIKDFALEPNEEKMRKSAHMMVQRLSGSLASVTCREPLRISIISNLRTLLLQNGFTEQTIPEQALFVTAADNLDLACSVIEKTAAEKAIPEIDDNLTSAFLSRKKHRERSGGLHVQPYYDMTVYAASRYPSTLPESLRLKAGGLTLSQLRVYEDFGRLSRNMSSQEANERMIRAIQPLPKIADPRQDPSAMFATNSNVNNETVNAVVPLSTIQAMEKFALNIAELEKIIAQHSNTSVNALPLQHEVQALLNQIPLLVSQSYNPDEVALIMSQKVMQLLYKNDTPLSRDIYVLLLERLCEMSKRVGREVNAWLLYADDERKYNVAVTVAIIQARLLSVPELDMQLARLMETGRTSVVDFTVNLIRRCVLDEEPSATQNDFFNSIEVLNKLAQRGKAPESVNIVLEELRKRTQITVIKDITGKDGANSHLREQLVILFTEWVRMYHHPASNEKSHAQYVMQLQSQGVLKGEDISSMFFRVCTELSVESFIKQKSNPAAPPMLAYQAVDAFARLIVLLIRYYADPNGVNANVGKLNLTTKILSIIVLVLVHSHEQRKSLFNQKPFFRLFSSLLNDLNTYEPHLQPIYFQILSAMSNTFHTLQPAFLPGFTFSWLQLISHRFFMPKLLLADNQKGWPFFQRLLVDLFKYLGPFLQQGGLTDTLRLLYKGTLRVLLVLLHDFPEFLCDYHFSFVDVIPLSCIQLRNLILSAFPRNMRLPDPFTPNLKVDLLPEINQAPHVLSDYTSSLLPNNFKQDIDTYLKTRGPVSFLIDLRSRLLLPSPNPRGSLHGGTKYNVPAINALVLYVGVQAILQAQSKPMQSTSPITHSAPMDIFQQLVVDLDTEGRYLFLSAIANQLRYPNSHTHYFSCVLLYLFGEANQEVIQEQITLVLLERLIVNRPHPYGLLITFIELIRNTRYNFWDHTNFIRCAPEIERLFDSVARSINNSYKAS